VITERETLQDVLARFRIPPRLLAGRQAPLPHPAGADLVSTTRRR